MPVRRPTAARQARRPWVWPVLPVAAAYLEDRAMAVVRDLDAPLRDSIGLPADVYDSLSRAAVSLLQVSMNILKDPSQARTVLLGL